MTEPHPIDALEKRVAELEERLETLYATLHRMPRLEGFVDSLRIVQWSRGLAATRVTDMGAKWTAEDKADDEQAARDRIGEARS